MELIAPIIFFAVVIGGAILLKKKKSTSSPVKGGGGTMPEPGNGDGEGTVTPPTGPMAE